MQRLRTTTLTALVIAYALGPLATQILTPAVPLVHRDFGVSMAAAQSLVSLAFVAVAIMTLVYGPLSDRYGRRPVVLAGTSLFCLGSLLAAVAPNPYVMIAGRIVQAAGSAAALTLTRTIVHDVYGRERSGEVLAELTTVMIFVPMLAPSLGGVLLDHAGWRPVFGICLLFGVIALALLAVCLPETHEERTQRLSLRVAFASFGSLLRDRRYLAPALFFAGVMAAIFATQAAIPYLMLEVLGGTAAQYGAWFGVACAFYVAGNAFTARWGHRLPRQKLILFSGVGSLVTAIAGAIATHIFAWTAMLLFVPTMLLYFLVAMAVAPVQAEAVAAQPGLSGAASGLLSALQMAVGAAVVQWVGFAHDGTPYPMFVTLAVCTSAAVALTVIVNLAPRPAVPTGSRGASSFMNGRPLLSALPCEEKQS